MNDLRPGDEVICIHKGPWRSRLGPLEEAWRVLTNRVPIFGATYTVTSVQISSDGLVCIDLKECPAPKGFHYHAECFRKVQRRDLKAWLSTSVGNTDKLDRPLKAPKRERVS